MSRRPLRRDLYADDFERLCVSLAQATRSFRPDLVIGVETGGARVAEVMLAELGPPKYLAVSIQRPATKVKSMLRFGMLLSHLPRSIVDGLRWAEVESRELLLARRIRPTEGRVRELVENSDLRSVGRHATRILIVDDTVDSGRTLLLVKTAVECVHPDAEVRTAVLASTWRRPPLRPDFCLLDRTLLRMPWSIDADPGA